MTANPFAYRPANAPVFADPIDWWPEARIAALVTVFASLLGSVVGLIWHAVAPTIRIVSAANGSAAAMKALLGDDMWLGLLGIVAGVFCVLALVLVAPKASDGPGAQLGLAVGGALGMLVAARVGHLIGHHDLTNLIRAHYPNNQQRAIHILLSYFDFKVRFAAVLVTWPLASWFVSTANVWVRAIKQPTGAPRAPYPGSP